MNDPNTSRQLRQVAESLESLEKQCVIALQIVQEALSGVSREASVLRRLAQLNRDPGQ